MTANQLQAPIDALRFIVEFAQMDLPPTSMRQLQAVERQVQRFINREMPGHWVNAATPDRVLLGALQSRAFSLLHLLVTVKPVRNLAIAGDLQLSFYAVREGSSVRVMVMGSPLDRLLYQIIRVLEVIGFDKLFECPAPECGRLFLKVTKKRFCSQRCQSRIYMRQLRAAERAERDALTPKGTRLRHGKTTRTR